MSLHQIRDAVMYVSKFLAINLELDPPDCSGLGDDPEDVSISSQFKIFLSYKFSLFKSLGENRGIYRLVDSQHQHVKLFRLDRQTR